MRPTAKKAWQTRDDVVRFEDDIANVLNVPLYSSTSEDSSESDPGHNSEKVTPAADNDTNNKTFPTENDFGHLLYENIVSEIRGMNVLSSYQLHYIRSLSHDKLLKIIELYNVVIRNVNEIL